MPNPKGINQYSKGGGNSKSEMIARHMKKSGSRFESEQLLKGITMSHKPGPERDQALNYFGFTKKKGK
jgi:hypothetical protein